MQDGWARQKILALMWKLTPGELSTLEAGSSHAGAAIMTMQGSANDLVCAEMEKQGWTKGRSETISADHPELVTRIYDIVEPREISALVAEHLRLRSLSGLLNGVCNEFVHSLQKKVREAGGRPKDVSVLLGAMIANYITMSSRPEEHNAVLDHIAKVARTGIEGAGHAAGDRLN